MRRYHSGFVFNFVFIFSLKFLRSQGFTRFRTFGVTICCEKQMVIILRYFSFTRVRTCRVIICCEKHMVNVETVAVSLQVKRMRIL